MANLELAIEQKLHLSLELQESVYWGGGHNGKAAHLAISSFRAPLLRFPVAAVASASISSICPFLCFPCHVVRTYVNDRMVLSLF